MPRGQADGDVIVDVLLNADSARKYWENFTSYMNMSTKQLERNLNASTRRINELENDYNKISQNLQNVRSRRADIAKIIEPYDKELQKIEDIKKEIKDLEKQRVEYLKSIPSNAINRNQKTTNGGRLTTLTAEETSRTENLTKQIQLLKQQQLEEEAIVRNLDSQRARYDELTLKVQELQKERKNAYGNLKEEATTFAQMNNQYAKIKHNEQEINQKEKENQKATKDTADNTQKIAQNTKNIKHHTANIGTNIRSGVGRLADGLKKIMRMGLALIGIRSLYTGISSALRTWMNSDDQLAKQTKANLENLKANIGSLLQPALQWVIGAFNNILGLVGAIVKQFTKLNIFANKTANSTNKMSKSASDTLASFDKIDVLKQDTGSGDSGDSGIQPIDMTSYVEKYERLAEEIKGILETIFDPIKSAWETKGKDVISAIKTSFESLKGLGTSVGSSIFEVWTNGTGQKTIEYILGIFENIIKTIGNIASAWDEAWKKDDKGTKIIQNIADILNSILDVIQTITDFFERLTASEGYKKFIDTLTDGLEVASGLVKFITETWAEMFKENSPKWAENFGKIFENIADTIQPVIDLLRQIFEDEKFQEFYKNFVETIGQLITVLTDWWRVLSDILALIVHPDWEHLKTLGEDLKTFGKDVKKAGEDTEKSGNSLIEFLRKLGEERTAKNPVQIATNMGAMAGIAPNLTGTLTAGGLLSGLDNKEQIGKVTKSFFENLGLKFKIGFETLKAEVSAKVKLIVGEIQLKFDALKELLPRTIQIAKEEIKTKFELMKGEVETKINLIKTSVETKWNGIKTIVTTAVETIKTTVSTKWGEIKETVERITNNIKTGISTKWEEIKSTVGEKVETIKSTIGEKFGTLKDTVKQKIEDVKTGIGEKWDEIKRTVGEKVEEVVDKIKTPFENIGTSIASALDTAWWNIRNALNVIIEGVENMINRITENLNDFTKTKISKVLTTGALGSVLSRFGVNINPGGTNFQKIHIPRLAEGGIVAQATPAIIGEAGKEAVLPLENNTEWMDKLADKISAGLNVGINFTGSLSQLAQVLKPEIDRENRRVGDSLIRGGNM